MQDTSAKKETGQLSLHVAWAPLGFDDADVVARNLDNTLRNVANTFYKFISYADPRNTPVGQAAEVEQLWACPAEENERLLWSPTFGETT
ncbi:MAG: hypothetical protein ACYCU5_00145 [Actinomycetes bacterium]